MCYPQRIQTINNHRLAYIILFLIHFFTNLTNEHLQVSIWGTTFLLIYRCAVSFFVTFLLYLWKKVLCFSPHTRFVCLSVCVSVIRIVTRWLDSATRYNVRILTLTTAQHCNIFKMIRFRFRLIWTIGTKSHFIL